MFYVKRGVLPLFIIFYRKVFCYDKHLTKQSLRKKRWRFEDDKMHDWNQAIKMGKYRIFSTKYSIVGCGVNGGNPDRNILTYVTSFNRTSWKSL
jgi:hypothetical protein